MNEIVPVMIRGKASKSVARFKIKKEGRKTPQKL